MMRAVILAAGKGERLWPLTANWPKPLLPVLCRPLIEWQIDTLRKFIDIRDIYIVMGSADSPTAGRLLSTGLGDFKIVEQESPMGTGDAVRRALEAMGTSGDDYILIAYSDIFIYPDLLESTIKRMEVSKPSILGVTVSDVSTFGELSIDDKEVLIDVKEKSGAKKAGIVNGGLMILPSNELMASVREIKLSARGEYELTDALAYMSKRLDIKVVTLSENEWADVGTPWAYLETNRRALSALCRGREECVLGEDNLEAKGAISIEGRLYVGGPVEVGPFASLRGDNILCGHNKIGHSSQVKSSVLLDGAKAPHLNYIGDSVLGRDVNMGAGSVTANLRHDEMPIKSALRGELVSTGMRKLGAIIGDEAKIGINVSILPGVKIGYRAWVDGGCVVYRDVPDNALVRCRGNLQISIRERRYET